MTKGTARLLTSLVGFGKSVPLENPTPDLPVLLAAAALSLAAGVLIGVLTRSPALAVGLGLVWSLVVENLLRGVANLINELEYVTNVLPGTAAGSMAGALGATAEGDGDGAPGVLTVLTGAESATLLIAYLVVFAVAAAFTMRRSDLA